MKQSRHPEGVIPGSAAPGPPPTGPAVPTSTSAGTLDAALFLAIVALAFVLRQTYVLQLTGSPLFDQPQMDELSGGKGDPAGTSFAQLNMVPTGTFVKEPKLGTVVQRFLKTAFVELAVPSPRDHPFCDDDSLPVVPP